MSRSSTPPSGHTASLTRFIISSHEGAQTLDEAPIPLNSVARRLGAHSSESLMKPSSDSVLFCSADADMVRWTDGSGADVRGAMAADAPGTVLIHEHVFVR